MSSNVEDERTTLRHTVLRRGITAGVSTALEIGPLDRPVLPRPDYDVLYADWAPTSVLRKKYADDPNVYEIVDVDIVWNGTDELSSVVPNGMTFDAVIASHVVEHVPDPVGWLQHLSSVLKPGGTVGLVIPDKRFTFDHNRRVSETADLIDAHVRAPLSRRTRSSMTFTRVRCPSIRQRCGTATATTSGRCGVTIFVARRTRGAWLSETKDDTSTCIVTPSRRTRSSRPWRILCTWVSSTLRSRNSYQHSLLPSSSMYDCRSSPRTILAERTASQRVSSEVAQRSRWRRGRERERISWRFPPASGP